jgi:hypothetical protein
MKFTTTLAVALVAGTVGAAASVLDELGQSSVDTLTFGIRSLEQDLRLSELETCVVATCRGDESRYVVSFAHNKPKGMPEKVVWPEGGAILIALRKNLSGPENASWVSEDGCKIALRQFEVGAWDRPWVNYARFFIPEREWRALGSMKDESPTADRMRSVNQAMFVLATVTHEGSNERASWISCVAPLLDIKSGAVTFNQGKFRK